jgi:hypothetical protein
MPRERRDLTGAIIAEKANWTNEEIIRYAAAAPVWVRGRNNVIPEEHQK